MKRQATSYVGSLALHAALLGWLSVAVAALPIQMSFQKGRASIELHASLAAAPREQDEPTPQIDLKPTPKKREVTQPVELKPTETKVARQTAEPPVPLKPDAKEKRPDKDEVEKTELAAAELPERPQPDEEVETAPPPRKQTDAEPRELEAAVESVAQAASSARSGVEYDTPAKPIYNRHPTYPRDAYARRQEGSVVLHLLITTSGTVGDVQIVRSSGVASLDAAAVDAARQWRYVPAQLRGMSVAMTFKAQINFYFNRG